MTCKDCGRKLIRELIKESLFQNNKYILPDPHICISDHLRHHIDNNITLKENVFRPSSRAFNELFREARVLYLERKLLASPDDEFLLDTDIGETDIYEGHEVPLDMPMAEEDDILFGEMNESEYQGKDVDLNKPKRNSGSGGKYVVYVRDPKKKGKNKVKRVTFGAKGMSVGIHDNDRVASFVARHNCKDTNDKTKASWWSCRLPRYAKSLGLGQTGKKWW